MKALPLLSLAALLAASSAAAAGECRYSTAHYRSPTGELGIDLIKVRQARGQVSDLVLRVRDERSHRGIADYYFDEGSAPRITLISTTGASLRGWRPSPAGGAPPLGTATFIGMGRDGRIEQTAPTSRTAAAPFVIIPELGQVLKASRVSVRRNDAFFLTSCGGHQVDTTARRES